MADIKENILNKELLIKQDNVAALKKELKSRKETLAKHLRLLLFMNKKETVTIKIYQPDYITILFNQLEEDGSEAFHGGLNLTIQYDNYFSENNRVLSVGCAAMTVTKMDDIMIRGVSLLNTITQRMEVIEDYINEWQEDYASAYKELLVAENELNRL